LDRQLPIGIFDSGVGGLTVYSALHAHLPNERFVYLGDTARVPYGTKSLATVERYAVENAQFLATRGIKLLVVACNTASALALPAIRRALNIDVVGVIGPGARAAAQLTSRVNDAANDNADGGRTGRPRSQQETRSRRRIGVIATESTVQSGAYTEAIGKVDTDAIVIERACPLFVPLAEEGWADAEVARTVAETYLKDLRSSIDTLVLGCTHYPMLAGLIGLVMGDDVSLVSSADETAKDVYRVLTRAGLLRSEQAPPPRHRYLCTGDQDLFNRLAERFLGRSVPAERTGRQPAGARR